jgi:hypothetical protein
MIRYWLHLLSQKLLGARVLEKQSRHARRRRVRPRLETLETRTMMSNFGLESPGWLPTPPDVSHAPPARGPEEPGPGSPNRINAPDHNDPGWEKLLQDVVAGPSRGQPSFSAPGLALQANANASATTFGTAHERLQIETVSGTEAVGGGKGVDNRDVIFVQPPQPAGSQALAITPHDAQTRGITDKSVASAFKEDRSLADAAPRARAWDAAPVPARGMDRALAAPEATQVIAPSQPSSAAETARVHSGFVKVSRDVPDGSLLQRYAVHRDEVAFAALVQARAAGIRSLPARPGQLARGPGRVPGDIPGARSQSLHAG